MKVHVQYPEMVIRDVEIEVPDDTDIDNLGFDDKVKLYNQYAEHKADYEVCYHFSTVCNIQIQKVA